MYEIIDNYRAFATKEHTDEKEQPAETEQFVESKQQETVVPTPEMVEEPPKEEVAPANQASEETKENPVPQPSDVPEAVPTVDDIYDFDGLSGWGWRDP